jgi:hypothetical protein
MSYTTSGMFVDADPSYIAANPTPIDEEEDWGVVGKKNKKVPIRTVSPDINFIFQE